MEKPTFEQVIELAEKQQNKGIRKYGQTVDDNPNVDLIYWVDHLAEELMDGLFYILRLKAGLTALSESVERIQDKIQKALQENETKL